ncbi:uncharacterized protein LOC114522292 [Dendronephthya gigantea]|uniref:uncharacterized protein LOC114522292 n=1 Tax=Dendronephthya gigantea TaxID=151771 RepID=UPI0010693B0F|nr:uncharacterized protein LOC114522292 [Dendronephthya gigantea]
MAENQMKIDAETLSALHKKLKDNMKKKAKDDNETEDFISSLLELYEDTVEILVRENVVICENKSELATSDVKQEMEPLDKERAKEVNEMCAKSEDLLVSTIKKRKIYPQKIKEGLQLKNDSEMKNLQNVENRIKEKENDADSTDVQFDIPDCDDSLPRLKSACGDLAQFSKSLSDVTENLERQNTVKTLKLKMESNELHRALFCERKIPSSFDSILESPTKELKVDETIPDSSSKTFPTLLGNQQNEQLEKLKSCKRKNH